jgi:hypothetical protein
MILLMFSIIFPYMGKELVGFGEGIVCVTEGGYVTSNFVKNKAYIELCVIRD